MLRLRLRGQRLARTVGRIGVDHKVETLLGGRQFRDVMLWVCSADMFLHRAIALLLRARQSETKLRQDWGVDARPNSASYSLRHRGSSADRQPRAGRGEEIRWQWAACQENGEGAAGGMRWGGAVGQDSKRSIGELRARFDDGGGERPSYYDRQL